MIAQKSSYLTKSTGISVTGGNTVQANMALQPQGEPSAGVLATRSVSYTAKPMVFEADVYVIDDKGAPISASNAVNFAIADAQMGNTGATFTFVEKGMTAQSMSSRGPYSAMILMDQSGSMSSSDPNDSRIEAGKIFLSALGAGDEVYLAAFASGGSLQYDITGYGNSFTSIGSSYFSTVQSLKNLVGGGTPLYKAIASMVDYVSTGGKNLNKAVVAFTDGQHTDGGWTVDQLVQSAVSKHVKVFTMGLSSNVDVGVLGAIATRTGRALMWAGDARQLVSLFGSLGGVLHGTAGFFRTQWAVSSSQNSFGSGAWFTTSIKVTLSDNSTFYAPVYVRIP